MKKFCTYYGSVDDFLLYYPYFLLFIALILFALERIFLKAFKAGNKLEKFYNLLVKEKILGVSEDEGRERGGDDFNHDGGVEAMELRETLEATMSATFWAEVTLSLVDCKKADGLLQALCSMTIYFGSLEARIYKAS